MITHERIRKACNDLAELLIAKNKDYGNSVQEQFNEYGETSLLIRLDDKLRRLKQLQKAPAKVKTESKKDTLTDTAGYAILGLLCLEDEPLKTIDCKPIERPSTDSWANFKAGNVVTVKYHDQDHQY
jgi:hypothetical protein